ncbi:MAG: pentapeptide repeat-containing protein [Chroococcales cyanobacterium]
MNNLERCYRVLEIEPGASLEEVNQAYKDLVFIWHPDRIPKENQRLQQKAVEKLKEINQAREMLNSIRLRTQARPSQPASASKYYYQRSPSSYSRPNYSPPPRSYYQKASRPNYQSTYASSSGKRPFYKDMTAADLHGANLKEKDLSGRNLSRANLSQANLSDSFLHKVNLEGANLFQANLFRANLFQANLRQANLQEANLIGADLSGADLSGANLRGAKVGTGDRILVKLTGVILTGAILPDGSVHT